MTSHENIRALAIDDDALTLTFYRDFFTGRGITLETAQTPAAGYDLLSRAAFDVLILDLWIGAADGRELLRTVRAEFPQLKVILVTAHCEADEEQAFFDQGVHSILHKPCTMRTVCECVQKAAMTA